MLANREDEDGLGGDEEGASKKAAALEVTLNANAALAYLKIEQWAEAAQKSTAALKKDPVRHVECTELNLLHDPCFPHMPCYPHHGVQNNSKALYRRGLARSRLGLLDEAKEDLMGALKFEPNSKEIRKEIQTIKERLAETKKLEKKAFGGFLNKVSRGLACTHAPAHHED